jgi:hypothetical protein
LAYGLLRGIPYEVMEKKCSQSPNFNTVKKHAKQFGGEPTEIESWVEVAKAYLGSRKEELRLAS